MAKQLVFTTTILILLGLTGLGQGYVQELNLYKNENKMGTVRRFKENLPYSKYCYDDWTLLCVRGFWLGFEYSDYDGPSTEIHGQDDQEFCLHRDEVAFKSFRHAGSLETSSAAISVYNMHNYEGTEVLVQAPTHTNLDGLSIVASTASEWTLYEENFLGGISVCMRTAPAPLVGFVGVTNVTQTFGLKQVGSVQIGCGGK